VATAPAAGASGRVFVPVAVVDELRGIGGTVTVRTADGELIATAGNRTVRAPVVPDEFPDWRRLEPAPAAHRIALDGPAFRAALAGGTATRKDRNGIPYDAVVLTLDGDGELTVGGDGVVLQVGVNRDFLLDALADHPQLTLELDGPITPLAIRIPGRADWSLLMPVDMAG
jgi:DNA polymerase III subunit beta